MSLTVSNIKAQDVHAGRQRATNHTLEQRGQRPLGKHTASIHVVPLHVNRANIVEVLLTRFPSTHPHWPDMWHVPGYKLQHFEKVHSEQKIHERVFGSIIHGLVVTIPPVKTEVVLHYTEQGKEVGHVYYAEVLGVPHTGTFFDIRSLPEDMPEHYLVLLKRAASAYRTLYS